MFRSAGRDKLTSPPLLRAPAISINNNRNANSTSVSRQSRSSSVNSNDVRPQAAVVNSPRTSVPVSPVNTVLTPKPPPFSLDVVSKILVKSIHVSAHDRARLDLQVSLSWSDKSSIKSLAARGLTAANIAKSDAAQVAKLVWRPQIAIHQSISLEAYDQKWNISKDDTIVFTQSFKGEVSLPTQDISAHPFNYVHILLTIALSGHSLQLSPDIQISLPASPPTGYDLNSVDVAITSPSQYRVHIPLVPRLTFHSLRAFIAPPLLTLLASCTACLAHDSFLARLLLLLVVLIGLVVISQQRESVGWSLIDKLWAACFLLLAIQFCLVILQSIICDGSITCVGTLDQLGISFMLVAMVTTIVLVSSRAIEGRTRSSHIELDVESTH